MGRQQQQLRFQASGSSAACGSSSILLLTCSSPVRRIKKEKRKKKRQTQRESSFRYTEEMIYPLVQTELGLPSAFNVPGCPWGFAIPVPGVSEVAGGGSPAPTAGLVWSVRRWYSSVMSLQPGISQPVWLRCETGSWGGRAKRPAGL